MQKAQDNTINLLKVKICLNYSTYNSRQYIFTLRHEKIVKRGQQQQLD